MSYQSQRPSRGRVPRGMGGLLDDLIDKFAGADIAKQIGDPVCAQAAQVSGPVRQRNAQIDDLRANWNPTGFYTAGQLSQAVAFTIKLTDSTTDALGKMIQQSQLNHHREMLSKALETVQRAIGVGGFGSDPLAPYIAAVTKTRAAAGNDGVIEAQGFKRTVLNVMIAVRDATAVYEAVKCARPPSLDFFAKVADAFNTLWEFLKSIGRLLKNVAQTIAKVPDALGTMFTVIKWGVLLGGTYFVCVKAGLIPPAYDPLRLRE